MAILFARAPVAGRVKTRLARATGAEAAARLHTAFVLDTAARAAVCAPIELHIDQPTDAWPELTCPRRVQSGGGLGERMLAALRDGLARGYDRVAVIGTDAPDLPAGHIAELLNSESDVCLGPAEDGGFWGICCGRIVDTMFDGVPWSSDRTLERTQAACESAGLTVSLAPRWADVDEPEDLARLAISRSLDRAGATVLELRKLNLPFR